MRPTLPSVGFCTALLSACLFSPLAPAPLWPWAALFPWVPAGAALVLTLLLALGLLFFAPLCG